MEKVAFGVQKQ